MAGKIEIKVESGIAKAPFLSYYPYWRWKITGDDGSETIITPTWDDLKRAISETMNHEKLVDYFCFNRRRNDNRKYKLFIKEVLEVCEKDDIINTEGINLDIYKNARAEE